MAPIVPKPRSSSDAAGSCAAAGPSDAALARRYERELGWPTAGRAPLRLLTGVRFDVLELPAEAGHAVLRRGVRTGPVLLSGPRTGFLVAAGGAEELPGLLDWLEWGPVDLDLTALGAGGGVTAPPFPAAPPRPGAPESRGGPEDSPGAAVWLRPPEPRHTPEPELPALARFGSSGGDAPDLVRLVDAVAAECHWVRLSRARAGLLTRGVADQPLAFS
ncbi:SCO3374 family protein [Streptomyces sp. NPDC101181]|uniref:SCO3374 family protein n=1 Tax=Streptomyces sp. NPDC101181 TaxID=3366125 RepID=UPI00382173B3